ncbi:pentafunctional AROM polypeptide [Aspergillus udagawae]|nr:pentafunctional AROM polypeptide [Aspergillus udagawae]
MSAPKKYYIIGQGISQSLSPVIHNTGFKYYDLPHHYKIQECSDLDAVRPLMEDPAFGGSSITMPYKLSVSEFCDSTSDSAATIGAINTLVVNHGPGQRSVHGDNTDWYGLYCLVTEYLMQNPLDTPVGLVIGAGGAARAGVYALIQAGVKRIYVVNRTLATAHKVVQDFLSLGNVIPVGFPSRLPETPDLIIGTVPGQAYPAESFLELFQKRHGLCIEMSYKPRLTNLLSLSLKQSGWMSADGLEVLLRQAFEQFRIWTGLEPPEAVMREAVAHEIRRRESSL